ncbi:MAG: response regulator transcription factor [Deltaproteobacteria bacterium]|nr:response regulator transcription factor [Deltaproteobacteria bacterium]
MADPRPRLLVVEDDLSVVQGLVRGLHRAGFEVSVAMDGAEGVRRALDEPFDLVILDLMLPGQDGFQVLDGWRGRLSVPVVVLSARTELEARLRSFDLGAVDFVQKPFWMEELVARIRTRLAMGADSPRRLVSFADVTVDLDGRRLTRGEEEIALTTHEFNVLAWLVERPDRAVSREQLAEHALPAEGDRQGRTLDSHVSRIRKKLGPEAAACVRTVWGIGYRFSSGGLR